MRETLYAVIAIAVLAGAFWFGFQWGSKGLAEAVEKGKQVEKVLNETISKLKTEIKSNDEKFKNEKQVMKARHAQEISKLENQLKNVKELIGERNAALIAIKEELKKTEEKLLTATGEGKRELENRKKQLEAEEKRLKDEIFALQCADSKVPKELIPGKGG